MDDFVINVRQVGNYPTLQYIGAYDLLLVQQGGVGGPYANVTQDGLLAQVYQRLNVGILPPPFNKGIASSYLITPIGQRQGFNWYVDEDGVQRYLQNGGAGNWNFDGANLVWSTLQAGERDDAIDTSAWQPVFTLGGDGSFPGLVMTGPIQWGNPPIGSINLTSSNFTIFFGGLPVFNVTPLGNLTVGGTISANGMMIANQPAATQQWVIANSVTSFNTRTGAITLQLNDIMGAGGATLGSPTFFGTPTTPTPASPTQSDQQIPNTAWVQSAIAAAGQSAVTSFNTRTGAIVLTTADITAAGGATQAGLTGYAPLLSPVFTGVPRGPTATAGTNTTELATTAFVTAAVVASTTGVSQFNGRTGAITLTAADITAAGGAPLASPAFTGTPTAPTPAPGDSDTSIATTAFVTAAIGAAGGVASFNGRNGAVTLVVTDVTNAGGAALASPAFTGTPTAPTAAAGTSTAQLATTAFVALAVLGSVTSFNSRTGAVTLTGPDITGAGGALIASPAFTGTPSAPTAVPGTSTTQLATTAFVQANVPSSVPSANVPASSADFANSITLAASDSGCIKNCTAASPVTVTLPGTLPKTFYCTIVQAGAGQISFVASGSASVHNRQGLTHSAGQYATCALTVMSTTGSNAAFVLAGDCA
jgi:hypothetical protein